MKRYIALLLLFLIALQGPALALMHAQEFNLHQEALLRNLACDHNTDYGVTTQTSGSSSLYQPFLYTHSELDPETGFYHNKARHYAPKFGKFLARDPIANLNLYSYCNGDPINFSDPSGKNPGILVLVAIGLAAEAWDYATGQTEANHMWQQANDKTVVNGRVMSEGSTFPDSPQALRVGMLVAPFVGPLARGAATTWESMGNEGLMFPSRSAAFRAAKRANRIPCSQNYYKKGPNYGKNPTDLVPIKGSRLLYFEGPRGEDLIIRDDFGGHIDHPQPHFNDSSNTHYDYPGNH